MSDTDDLVKYSHKHNTRIKKICEPLFRHLGFNGIFYHHISNDGRATSCGSDLESFEYFCNSRAYLFNPFIRHPDFFRTSMLLIPEIQDAAYQETIRAETENFDLFYKVIFLEKTADGCQGFSFATPKNMALNIDDVALLQRFIKFFTQETSDILSCLVDDARAVEKHIGRRFFEDPITAFTNRSLNARFEFLKKLGIIHSKEELELTQRERDCMRLVLKGYSAGQIAEILSLSKRTVEHYLENIKLKSNCDTKAALITKFREIEQLGVLQF